MSFDEPVCSFAHPGLLCAMEYATETILRICLDHGCLIRDKLFKERPIRSDESDGYENEHKKKSDHIVRKEVQI
jgi:hypothetical protein